MTLEPTPPIDRRTASDVQHAMSSMLEASTSWRRGTDDGIEALLVIASRLGSLVQERLNRSLDKHARAFLNLAGADRRPAASARAPVTFSAVSGAPPGVTVPAGARLEAAPSVPSGVAIPFTVDRDVVLTKARPLYSMIGERNEFFYRDVGGVLDGSGDGADLDLREAERHVRHLVVGLEGLDGDHVRLHFGDASGVPTPTLRSLVLDDWEWQDGIGWRSLEAVVSFDADGTQVFDLRTNGAGFVPSKIDDAEAIWLRARADARVSLENCAVTATCPTDQGARPLAAAFGATGEAIDLSLPFLPFGPTPSAYEPLYLLLPEPLPASTEFVLSPTYVERADPPTPQEPEVVWEVFTSGGWSACSWHSGAPNLAEIATPSFDGSSPAHATVESVVSGVRGHWMRAMLTSGSLGDIPGHADSGTWVPAVMPLALAALSIDYVSEVPVPVTEILFDEFGRRHAREDGRQAFEREDLRTAEPAGQPPVPPDLRRSVWFIGFDASFDNLPVTLFVSLAAPPLDELSPTVRQQRSDDEGSARWSYLDSSLRWRRVHADDETNDLLRDGPMTLLVPSDAGQAELFGRSAWWIRADVDHPLDRPRHVRSLLTNTTWSIQQEMIHREVVGAGEQVANQHVRSAHMPVLDGEVLTVLTDEGEERWERVESLGGSGPDDPHYTIERTEGLIRFGDGRRGRKPPRGTNNLLLTYATGGGSHGNVEADRVTELVSGVPHVAGVTNPLPGIGGREAESDDQAAAAASARLRHRNRVVTASDAEAIVLHEFPEIARVYVADPRPVHPTMLFETSEELLRTALDEVSGLGEFGVVVVPHADVPQQAITPDLLQRIHDRLTPKMSLGVDRIWVSGPNWCEIVVVATVFTVDRPAAGHLAADVSDALDDYLHPNRGGRDNVGWRFGEYPTLADIYRVIGLVPGVRRAEVSMSEVGEPRNTDIVYAGRHTIDVQWDDAAVGDQP